jgi:hypothetical protein
MDRFVTSIPLGHTNAVRRGGGGSGRAGGRTHHCGSSGKRSREELEGGAEIDSKRSEVDDADTCSQGAGARVGGKAAVQMYLDLGQVRCYYFCCLASLLQSAVLQHFYIYVRIYIL